MSHRTDTTENIAEVAALSNLPEKLAIPRDDDGPIFAAPWEGQIFAAAVQLRESGVLAWSDFVKYLTKEIRSAEVISTAHPTNYYLHWLDALERILADKKLTNSEDLVRARAKLLAAQHHNSKAHTDEAHID